MCKIETISYNCIKLYCDDNVVEEIKTGYKYKFTEDYLKYDKGDIIKVEPYLESDEYYIKIWSEEHNISYLNQEGIYNLICGDKLKRYKSF